MTSKPSKDTPVTGCVSRTVSMPKSLEQWAESRRCELHRSTFSAYIQDLIRADMFQVRSVTPTVPVPIAPRSQSIAA